MESFPGKLCQTPHNSGATARLRASASVCSLLKKVLTFMQRLELLVLVSITSRVTFGSVESLGEQLANSCPDFFLNFLCRRKTPQSASSLLCATTADFWRVKMCLAFRNKLNHIASGRWCRINAADYIQSTNVLPGVKFDVQPVQRECFQKVELQLRAHWSWGDIGRGRGQNSIFLLSIYGPSLAKLSVQCGTYTICLLWSSSSCWSSLFTISTHIQMRPHKL